jgi:hypothetical protein
MDKIETPKDAEGWMQLLDEAEIKENDERRKVAEQKEAEIDAEIFQPSENEDSQGFFSRKIFDQLPKIFREFVEIGESPAEKDLLLLGGLVSISSILPNVFGYYDKKKVHPNLYVFIVAPPSAGKGVLSHCRAMLWKVHNTKKERYNSRIAAYDLANSEYAQKLRDGEDVHQPTKPTPQMHFLPANSSATGFYELLFGNDSEGYMFETEGDTLANIFKSDFGNFSDGFRKAFHHEPISYYRKTNSEICEIEEPRLSVLLSGTPSQVHNLIPNAENGLFSRFMFYKLHLDKTWRSAFGEKDHNFIEDYLSKLGHELHDNIFEKLNNREPMEIVYSQGQKLKIEEQFKEWTEEYSDLHGEVFISVVRRMGLIGYRISMVLTVLRNTEELNSVDRLTCTNEDFDITYALVTTLLRKASNIFTSLPSETMPKGVEHIIEQFFGKLPDTFSRADYVKVAISLDIPDSTAQNHIKKFLDSSKISRVKQNHYVKNSHQRGVSRYLQDREDL